MGIHTVFVGFPCTLKQGWKCCECVIIPLNHCWQMMCAFGQWQPFVPRCQFRHNNCVFSKFAFRILSTPCYWHSEESVLSGTLTYSAQHSLCPSREGGAQGRGIVHLLHRPTCAEEDWPEATSFFSVVLRTRGDTGWWEPVLSGYHGDVSANLI